MERRKDEHLPPTASSQLNAAREINVEVDREALKKVMALMYEDDNIEDGEKLAKAIQETIEIVRASYGQLNQGTALLNFRRARYVAIMTSQKIMLDREVSKLINKTARELVEVQEQAGDVDAFPQALEKIVGRKFAFKVEVADYNIEREWYVYTIVKMTDDKHVIGELLKKVLHSEESLNEQPGSVNGDSSVGFGGVKDAFSVTGENNTRPNKRKLEVIPKPDFEDSEDTPNKKPKFDLVKDIKIEKP
ncbi:replication protein A 70 kDa DNA-binding subunit B [Tanacetum coccineum]